MQTKKSLGYWVIFYAILAILVLWSLFPILWMIGTTLKVQRDAMHIPPLFTWQPTLENWQTVLGNSDNQRYLVNTLVISIGSTTLSLIVGISAAYALARFHLPAKEDIAGYILSVRMFPPIAAALPIFLIFKNVNLLDTQLGLMIAYLTFNLPFVVWMMRGFIEAIPYQLEEAAMVDGRSRLGAFVDQVVPLIKPSVVAVAIFCVIFSWNEFLFALILATGQSKTLPLGIAEYLKWTQIVWANMTTAATLLVLPVLIFTFFVQRYLVRGLTMGAVRG